MSSLLPVRIRPSARPSASGDATLPGGKRITPPRHANGRISRTSSSSINQFKGNSILKKTLSVGRVTLQHAGFQAFELPNVDFKRRRNQMRRNIQFAEFYLVPVIHPQSSVCYHLITNEKCFQGLSSIHAPEAISGTLLETQTPKWNEFGKHCRSLGRSAAREPP